VKLCDNIILTGCDGKGEQSSVEVVNVGLVVLGVVEGHDLCADVGFEGLG
jgi:hypothetical protein